VKALPIRTAGANRRVLWLWYSAGNPTNAGYTNQRKRENTSTKKWCQAIWEIFLDFFSAAGCGGAGGIFRGADSNGIFRRWWPQTRIKWWNR